MDSNRRLRSITENLDDYDEKYMKMNFDLGDELALNEMVEIPIVTIVIRDIFHENNKCYPQVLLDECLYKIQ